MSQMRSSSAVLSPLEIEERAATARDILNTPLIRELFETMHSRQVGILLEAPVGSLTASAAHAMMRAIRELQSELQSVVTDKKMYERFNRGKSDE
jgi:hypothetical protein